MRLTFKLNPEYVFLHAINMSQYSEPFLGWSRFTNNIWEKDRVVFYFLAGAPEYILFVPSLAAKRDLIKKTEKEFKKIKQSKEYKRIVSETKNYLSFVKSQWECNEKIALNFLQEIYGATLPKLNIRVYITHPKLRNGMALDEHTIVWGHSEDFRNYSTVYLAHELLHILTHFDRSDIAHAIIELAADEELRIRLNKKGKYFEYPGHRHLLSVKKKILPYWKKYLREEKKDIFTFIKDMKRKWG